MTRRRSRLAPLLALPAMAALSSCAPGAGGSGSARGASTPVSSGPRVVLPSGAVLAVEIARTDVEKAQGLMYRESLAEGAGMIFLWDGEEIRPFWMKNCHFPLDIVHAKKDGTVVDVLEGVPPCPRDPCPSYPPKAASDTVLEINAGLAAKHRVAPGATLRYLDIPGR